MAALEAPLTLESLAQQQKLLESTIDTVWIIIGSIFVVFMQVGAAPTTRSLLTTLLVTVDPQAARNPLADATTPVFFLQAGFAFLEAGSVRAKNLKNILLKVKPIHHTPSRTLLGLCHSLLFPIPVRSQSDPDDISLPPSLPRSLHGFSEVALAVQLFLLVRGCMSHPRSHGLPD